MFITAFQAPKRLCWQTGHLVKCLCDFSDTVASSVQNQVTNQFWPLDGVNFTCKSYEDVFGIENFLQTASKHTQWWWVGPASGCSQSFSHSVIQSISHRVIYYSHVWLRKNDTRTPPSDHPLWVNWLITVRWILIKSHVCLLYTSLFPSNQTQMSGRNVFSVQHQHELCVWFNLTLVTPRATWKIKVTRW